MSYLRQCLWAVLGYLLISGSCDAQTLGDQKPAADSSATDVASISRHLLDQMQQRGVTFHGQLVNDWSKNLSDGDDPAYGFGRYSLDLSASVESEKSLG
jgi:carbohydrate-selective porin OprB